MVRIWAWLPAPTTHQPFSHWAPWGLFSTRRTRGKIYCWGLPGWKWGQLHFGVDVGSAKWHIKLLCFTVLCAVCCVLCAGFGGCVLLLLRCGCHRNGVRPPTGLQQVGTALLAIIPYHTLILRLSVSFLSFFVSFWVKPRCRQTLLYSFTILKPSRKS